MSIDARRYRGVTLIELIVFIVIVSVGLAGVLSSLNISARGSADPLQPKQALAIAESLMEEVLHKTVCDPDASGTDMTAKPPVCGTNGSEARSYRDSVDDYDTDVTDSNATSITKDVLDADLPSGYTASIMVQSTTLDGVPSAPVTVRKITVAVGYAGGSVSLIGYRANY